MTRSRIFLDEESGSVSRAPPERAGEEGITPWGSIDDDVLGDGRLCVHGKENCCIAMAGLSFVPMGDAKVKGIIVRSFGDLMETGKAWCAPTGHA